MVFPSFVTDIRRPYSGVDASSSRNGTKVDRIEVHHFASVNNGNQVVEMMRTGARQVSANLVVTGKGVVGVIDFDRRAYTSGSAYDGGKGAAFDRRSITIEVENNAGAPNWTVADSTFDHLARAIAHSAHWAGMAINDNTVLTHQELWTRFQASYPTACPGGLQRRKAELLKLANKYLAEINGGTIVDPKPTPNPAPSGNSNPYPGTAIYGAAFVKRVQEKFIRLGYNLGSYGADGLDGALTQAAAKAVQKRGGITQDGIVGPNTEAVADRLLGGAVKAPAFPLPSNWYFGPESGPQQSVSGHHGNSQHLKTWQTQMKKRGWIITPDGLYGPETQETAIYFQREKGLVPDGLIGPATWKAAFEAPLT